MSDISALENLNNLERLEAWGNKISDLESLANLTNLRRLGLGWSQPGAAHLISDIELLAGFTNLEALSLWGTR